MLIHSPLQPLLRPLLRDPTEWGGPANAAQVAALFQAKSAIQQDSGDVSLLVIGDSTGNGTDEWVYLFGQWLVSQYPTHSVSYRLWDDTNNVYATAVVLGTGSGANTIRIWNASVNSTTTQYLMGAKFADSIVATDPDLVIWNHGKNMAALATTAGVGLPALRGEFLGGMEQVRLALPGVPHAAFRQIPNRDDNAMQVVVEEVDRIAASYGDLARIDAYAPFMAASKNSSLFIDNLHPSTTGSLLILAAMQAAWQAAASVPTFAVAPAFLSVNGTNLLTNTKFDDGAAYSGGTPTGWSNLNGTCTADTSIKDTGKTQSLKLVGTTAGSLIYKEAVAGATVGKKVTLAVRQYVPPVGATAGMGRVVESIIGGAAPLSYSLLSPGAQLTGGWRWIIVAGCPVNLDSTTLRSLIYCDNNANASSAVYYSRVILVEGDVPRNIA